LSDQEKTYNAKNNTADAAEAVETRRTRKHDTSKTDASIDETTRVASDEPLQYTSKVKPNY